MTEALLCHCLCTYYVTRGIGHSTYYTPMSDTSRDFYYRQYDDRSDIVATRSGIIPLLLCAYYVTRGIGHHTYDTSMSDTSRDFYYRQYDPSDIVVTRSYANYVQLVQFVTDLLQTCYSCYSLLQFVTDSQSVSE